MERTEGSSINIKNDSSAPYCGLTASSSQAGGLFVCLLCQRGWSLFLNRCTFQLQLFVGEGDEQRNEKKRIQKKKGKNRDVGLLPVFHPFNFVYSDCLSSFRSLLSEFLTNSQSQHHS